jgi:hypothetical protein
MDKEILSRPSVSLMSFRAGRDATTTPQPAARTASSIRGCVATARARRQSTPAKRRQAARLATASELLKSHTEPSALAARARSSCSVAEHRRAALVHTDKIHLRAGGFPLAGNPVAPGRHPRPRHPGFRRAPPARAGPASRAGPPRPTGLRSQTARQSAGASICPAGTPAASKAATVPGPGAMKRRDGGRPGRFAIFLIADVLPGATFCLKKYSTALPLTNMQAA